MERVGVEFQAAVPCQPDRQDVSSSDYLASPLALW